LRDLQLALTILLFFAQLGGLCAHFRVELGGASIVSGVRGGQGLRFLSVNSEVRSGDLLLMLHS
jgi:hypothetical protein